MNEALILAGILVKAAMELFEIGSLAAEEKRDLTAEEMAEVKAKREAAQSKYDAALARLLEGSD